VNLLARRVPEQAAGDDEADAIDGAQRAAVLGDGGRDLCGERLQPLISVSDLGDQVAGQLLARPLRLARPGGR
jgi:hypothetical protein